MVRIGVETSPHAKAGRLPTGAAVVGGLRRFWSAYVRDPGSARKKPSVVRTALRSRFENYAVQWPAKKNGGDLPVNRLSVRGAFAVLEPYAGKLARTVLRSYVA